jgi:DNA-binding NtrC family response regulator
VPDELIESTLFGHVKGAFTGANTEKTGVLAEADGGTVFLDEIGELKSELQPALLRVLDRGMIRPVGATSYQNIDVRVVAATHKNLGDLIATGGFREDLYYRLAVVRLAVPPLRDRREDLPLLVRHFLGRMGRPDVEITENALALMSEYHWPGNVRELRNAVERTMAMSLDGRFSAEAIAACGGLAPPGRSADAPVRDAAAASGAADAAASTAGGSRRPFRDAKADAIETFERAYLGELCAEFESVTAAADAAGMDRKHLRTLLKRYQLDIGSD